MDRRHFFTRAGSAAVAAATLPQLLSRLNAAQANLAADGRTAAELASNEAFWNAITAQFAPAPEFINLEYGYFCPAALPTLEVELREARRLNSQASYYKRTRRQDDTEGARADLARLAGVSAEEVVLTRNTTESLNILYSGLDFEAGDEIVYSNQDYGSMVEGLRQMRDRHGVVLKEVAIPLHPASDEEVVEVFRQAITPKTRLLHVTHMINLTGHVLPVRKISDMAHERGIEVLADSAHAFAHVDFKIPDLGVDYCGTSLHKWLCSPHGLGMLYVRKDKIEKIWPLMGDTVRPRGDIRKLERLGTRPENALIGLREAIRFHEKIGGEVKQARLRHLNQYWTSQVRDLPGVRINTP
ncbi:MAG: aminotransferase class V-fold PLP-dependent enzyme, partial [Verrucomicrobiota bacterium]